VVDDVSLVISGGETLAVVGESGAGKSTLGRLVLRLIEPDSGAVMFNGLDLRAMSRRDLRRQRARMQMVFQDPYTSLNPKMTIGAAVEESLLLHTAMRAADRKRKARDLLMRVGIRPDQLNRYPYELSGGQLQRVAIARAIAPDSDFIVCDEPVAALDVSIRAQVLNLLRDLQVERDLAYLFISHDLSLVSALAHRVAVMYRGRFVEVGSTEQVFERPQHPYTKLLLASILEPDPRSRRSARFARELGQPVHAASDRGCPFD